MEALRNLFHGIILAAWGVAGALFTLHAVFGVGATAEVIPVLSWWAWFAGYAAATTFAVRAVKHALAAPAIHAGAYLVLVALPTVLPFSLLRLGIDLLRWS